MVTETDAAANNKEWRAQVNGAEWLLQVQNDAKNSTATALRIRRSAQAVVLNFPTMPSSAAGLVSGDLWCDAGASNVIKRVP